jgi:hypothetical protein
MLHVRLQSIPTPVMAVQTAIHEIFFVDSGLRRDDRGCSIKYQHACILGGLLLRFGQSIQLNQRA